MIHYCTRIYYSMIRSVEQFACQQPSVSLSIYLSVCLSIVACFCLYIYVSVCLYVCFAYRSVCRWFVCRRSVGLYVCSSLALGQSVCGQSAYALVCVPLYVYMRLSTCLSLSLCLSVCLFVFGRSVSRSVGRSSV